MSSDSIITLSADNFEIVALSNDTSGLETGQNLVSLLNATEGERLKTRLTSLEALPTTCFRLTLKDKLRTLSAMKQDAHYCLTLHRLSDDPIAESLSEMERFDEIEDALRKSNTQLNDFVYTIAHQLKEPLRQVASYAELINESTPVFLNENPDIIGFVIEGAKRADRLVSELLAYSRLDHGTSANVVMTNVDAGRLVKEVAQFYRDQAEFEIAPLPQVRADRDQFRQVLAHLIENAVKFGGKKVSISALEEDDEVRFFINDDGIGIAPKDHGRIFSIFTTLNPRDEYEGTGLGLALCERIIDRWGGRLGLESEPGKGSTFYFTVPKRENTLD